MHGYGIVDGRIGVCFYPDCFYPALLLARSLLPRIASINPKTGQYPSLSDNTAWPKELTKKCWYMYENGPDFPPGQKPSLVTS